MNTPIAFDMENTTMDFTQLRIAPNCFPSASGMSTTNEDDDYNTDSESLYPDHDMPSPLTCQKVISTCPSSSVDSISYERNFLSEETINLENVNDNDDLERTDTNLESIETENNDLSNSESDDVSNWTQARRSKFSPAKQTSSNLKDGLAIRMKRAEPHFMKKTGQVTNFLDLKDHAKRWKKGQGDDWKLSRNNRKHVFPYSVKKKLKKSVNLINRLIKSKNIHGNLVSKDDKTRKTLAQNRISSRKLGTLEIDLGSSVAAVLTRSVHNRKLKPTIEDSVPVKFLTYSDQKVKSLTHHLHFDADGLQNRTQALGNRERLSSFTEPSSNSPSPVPNVMKMDTVPPA